MKTRINLKYLFIAAFAVAGSWFIHEFAHWSVGEILGYDMKMTLNTAGIIDGSYGYTWERLLVSAAGPFVTIVQAVAFWILIMKRPNQYLFPFIFTPLYFRALASFMNIINLNDEGRISHAMGIGTYTLPIIVTLFLFVLVYSVAKKLYLRKSFIAWNTLLVMIFSSVIILSDQMFQIRLI
ncbi:hypothetical protein [Ekhidna sp.]|uniref:hypothetical protein n=1 Tax=Ekhidna sp. TaxID=2608089 RepID=UPI003BA9B9B3